MTYVINQRCKCMVAIVETERSNGMKLNIEISDKYDETSISIHAKEWTKELEELVKKLEQ